MVCVVYIMSMTAPLHLLLLQRRKEAEEERLRQEQLCRQERWKADLVLLREGRGMEAEDHRGSEEVFSWWLNELERRALSRGPEEEEEARYLLEAMRLLGLPPVPPMIGSLLKEREEVAGGMRRLNYDLGGESGTDPDQQRLLRLVSRWLIMHSRCRKIIARLSSPSPTIPVPALEPDQLALKGQDDGTISPSTPTSTAMNEDPRRALLDAIAGASSRTKQPPPPPPQAQAAPEAPSSSSPPDPRSALLSAVTASANARSKRSNGESNGGNGVEGKASTRTSGDSANGSSSLLSTPPRSALMASILANSRKALSAGAGGGNGGRSAGDGADPRNAFLASIPTGGKNGQKGDATPVMGIGGVELYTGGNGGATYGEEDPDEGIKVDFEQERQVGGERPHLCVIESRSLRLERRGTSADR